MDEAPAAEVPEAPEEEPEPPRPRYRVMGDYQMRIDSSPIDEPESEQELGGYRYGEPPSYDALAILKEYWTSGETSELEDLVGHIRTPEEEPLPEEEAEAAPPEEPEKAPEDEPEEAPSATG